MTGEPRTKSIKSLRRELDRVFSIYIRRRDTASDGIGRCITCGKNMLLQCGHFIKRQHSAVRWDERNSHGQCVRCNKWLHGNDGNYALAIARRYGIGVLEELIAAKHKAMKFTRADLEAMIERYR